MGQKQNYHLPNKNHQTNTLISLTDTYQNPGDTNTIEAENRNITDSQRQDLDKGIKMEKTIKGKLYQKQNSNATWIVTTFKRLIIKPVKKLGKQVLPFKGTQEAAQKNSQILAAFNGNLGSGIEAQMGSPIYYGSEFRDITIIKNLFRYHNS